MPPRADVASTRRRLIYVDDGVPPLGTQFIQRSCAARNVDFVPLNPIGFEFSPSAQLHAGDLLYRPAISFVAQLVEQFIWAPGVATFYADDDLFFGCLNPLNVFQRGGLPVPRTITCLSSDRDILDRYATRLGGYPLVYKIPGFSTGVGVGRLDSPASLYSFVDLALGLGRFPQVMAYVPDAVHWRLVVVGDRVAGSYRSPVAPQDFRTVATRDLDDYTATPPEDAVRVAVRSTELMRHELGGVDVLAHESGRVYLLENNFPCYFAQAQDVAGADVSGAMIDHLIAKAERLERGA